MKGLRALLVVLLTASFLLLTCPAYADDGKLEVEIAIIGDDADVGVDIHGNDAEVRINGQNLAEPTVIRVRGRRGASKSWVSKQLDQIIVSSVRLGGYPSAPSGPDS